MSFCRMVQYGEDGRVIPHYWGEDYRGFDIFKTYYLHRGKLYECWMGRDPYNDKDLFTCNLLKAPLRHRTKTREEICEWIDKYTFLAQPDLDETSRLSGSIWDYEWDERDQCWIYPI